PSRWRMFVRRWFTRLELATRGDEIRDCLLRDPCLCNARHYGDHKVMAIHYNTEVDPRAALTADEVRALITRQPRNKEH
ncbi:MAG: hypothetical protein ACMG5Z_05960, partial [Luteimonas sp.]